MSFNDEYLKLRKKRLEAEESRRDNTNQNKVYLDTLFPDASSDIAPVRQTAEKKQTTTTDERKWFEKGAFEDGYQFGDITKSLEATMADLRTNAISGILGMGEKVVDTGAYIVGGIGGLFSKDFKNDVGDFIKKDLYDEEDIAKAIVRGTTPGSWLDKTLVDEDNSFLGEKTDALVQSGGQLLGTIGLQAAGVPWFVTSGVTSFGSEAENALNQGATYDQAGLSAAITAGAELLTEKLFGGSGLGEKGFINLDSFTKGISNKVVKMVADVGIDLAAEGTEEVLSSVFGAVGQKLSYASEQEWNELCSREDLFEAFVGGAVLSGVANAGKIANSAKTGRDYRTGLTESEQKVFDNVYNKRIAEAQEGGKELSQKEKDAIYDSVMNDLEKGRIDTDTIEEVLGDDVYKSYKDTIDYEDNILKQYEELGKKTNPTLAEMSLYDELKSQYNDIKQNSQREAIKANLSQEVQNKVKDTKLAESYAERARRGQAFEADLSQYDEKQQEVIKKAVESGILNNTRRTHEFVDLIAKISADKGVLFDFTNNKKLKESGFAVDGKEVNGFVTKAGISINIDSHKALQSTVGHEITHVLEGTELYAEMQKALFDYAKSKGDFDGRRQSLAELYKDIKDADVDAELTADLVGDYLFTDENFVKQLSTQNRNVFQKIYDEIKYLWKLATAGGKEARELEKVKRAFDKAYKESGKASEGTKYSLAMVDAVKPTTNKWAQSATTDEVRASHPTLYAVDETATEERNPTQVKGTVGSYRKVYESLKSEGFNGTILDASSGLGYGTKAGIEEYGFDVEDIEPYPDSDYKPKYTDYSALNKKYDVVISNAVLNVLPQDQRDALTVKMGELLNPGGRMFVNVRGKDVLNASGKIAINESNMEYFIPRTAKTGSYQKGFTKSELVAYLEDALGEGYTVKPTNMFGAVSAIVTKDGAVKYSIYDKKTIDKFSQKQYNDFGWARHTEAITENELDDMYSKIHEKGSLKKFPQTKYGESVIEVNDSPHIIEANNTFVFVKGSKNSPEITRVVRVNFYDEASIDVFRKDIYENTDNRSLEAYARVMGEEIVQYYDRSNSASYREYSEQSESRSSGSESKGNQKVARRWDIGDTTDTKTQSNDITPNKASSKDGVFFDGKKQYSLSDSDGKQLTKGQQEYFKDSKVRDENGNLLVMYHGTKKGGFTVFQNKRRPNTEGFYFTNSKEYSDTFEGKDKNGEYYDSVQEGIDEGYYTPETYEVYLDVKNPFVLTADQQDIIEDIGYWENIYKPIKNAGYDGVMMEDMSQVFVFNSNQIKSVANEQPTKNADIRYSLSKADNDYISAVENGDTETAQKMVDKVAHDNGYTVKAYHGTRRADRVGNVFLPERATSGPMAFFTDNKDIADNYARNKADTSLAYDTEYDSYYTQFRVNRNGKNVSIPELWNYLSYSERNSIKEKAKHIKFDDDYENIIVDSSAEHGNGAWDAYTLNMHKGNALEALVDTWLETGDLYNREADFIKVLDLVGISDVEYRDPDAHYEKTYDTWLKIQNPFDTDNANQSFYDSLQEWIDNNDMSVYEKESSNADFWDKNNQSPESWLDKLSHDIENGTTHAWTVIPDFVTDYLKQQGYDGIKDKGGKGGGAGHTVWIPFSSEQVKSADAITYDDNGNVIPLSERFNAEKVDIRNSLSAKGEPQKRYGNYNIYGKDVRYEAPMQEQVAPSVDISKMETTTPTVSKMEQVADYAPITEEEANALQSENITHLDDADVPPEMEAPYYGETQDVAPIDPFEDRDMKEVSRDRKTPAYMYENPEVKPFFQAEANVLLGELERVEKPETIYNGWAKYEMSYEFAQDIPEIYRTERIASDTIVYLRDTIGMSYADIEKGLKAIIEDNGAENIAAAKKLEFVINDRLLYGYNDDGGFEIPANQDYINLLTEKQIREYSEEARKQFFDVADAYTPQEDIAPVAESKAAPVKERYEAIKPERKKNTEPRLKRVKDADDIAPTENKTAEIYDTEPETGKKKSRGWARFRANFLDKQSVFEDLALKTSNRELMGKANYILSAEQRAQRLIGKGKSGAGVKSLNDIRAEVENTGKTKQFYEYLYHKHNIDRMSLEESKPVFGDSVTADVSRAEVAKYEAANPKFTEYAQDVYDYMNYLRDQMVESGVISQETADLWAQMYPHYVPIRRLGDTGLNINVPLDTGRTGVNAPIKKATGGSRDILPLFDTMALRTEQTYKAIAKNNFGVELKNTLGSTIESAETNLDEMIDSVDAHEELLKKGENGRNPTFTVFEDGKKVTFEITEDMYDALKPTSDDLRYTNKVANTVGNIHRGLLTEYNPTFMLTNAIKDAQDILINSQHPAKTYANLPNAIAQMAKNGTWYQEYLENGGESNTYFDGQSNTFTKDDTGIKKIVGMPLRAISAVNNYVERAPRLAEYIASRKAGASAEVAMLDAARVTTNFAAGGDVTKWANRNGFTFLNASVQGAMQQVRNVREAKANGLKGWVQLATKVAIAGIPAMILNNLLWDDDEEYEQLSDYVKDNYYVVAKYGDGKFVRIPKGRALAVIQDALEQVGNALTGDDEVDLANFLELAISNLAPNNPLDNNILAPIGQVLSNKTWYGDDLVPTRLQDLPAAEQFDESTDSISKWLGEKLNISPYKLNYLLNQYSGGIGDVALPMLTPEAESGDNSLAGNLLAPMRDKFTTDSVMNNQNVSDFYDTVDKLTANAKSSYATDEDILKYKYMNSVNAELSELYKQKREIQNSNLADAKKYEAVRDIQKQIDTLAEESLNTYGSVNIDGGYAAVGDRYYKLNDDGEWVKITDKQLEKQEEVTSGLGIDPSTYWENKSEYDFAYEYPEKYAVAKSVGGYEKYKTYQSEMYDIKADKDEDGKSIVGSRKDKVADYINNLDADYGEKIILFKSEYNADDTYNYEIIDYLNNRNDISYDEMVAILRELGFTVKGDTITWD